MTGIQVKREHGLLLLIVLGGLLIRLTWLVQVHDGLDGLLYASEGTNAALAVARSGSVADAYFPGQGPSAHLLPLNPLVSGFILWLFGPESSAASLALLGWALAQVGCGYLLFRALFARLGADPAAVRWGTALLFLVPPFVPQEVVDFRYWEGATALCLAGANLLLIARLDAETAPRRRTLAGIAALSAVTFFVSPPVGLAVDACWAVFALRRLPPLRVAQFAAASAAAVALLVTPWAIRNARVLGEPVLLRSNFGIELALANHPAALSDAPPERVFAARIDATTPSANAEARRILMQRGGEVRYARALGSEASAWIAANPGGFALLYLRHLREFFFPRAWQMYFTGWEGMREARAATISLVNLLGLISLGIGLAVRRRGYWMLAIYVAAVALPYALFQPMPRYIFLAYAPLAFLAAEVPVRLARRYRGAGSAR